MLYPNPFNPDTAVRGTLKVMGMPEGSNLVIYTVSGEWVKNLQAGNGSNGLTEWDGLNDWGGSVATGTYLWVARLGDKTLASGALILRRGGN